MSKAEEFIHEHTMNCNNLLYRDYVGRFDETVYQPWLTPYQAREAVRIAREEMLNEICEWIGKQEELLEDSFSGPNDFADILKQEIEL